MTSPAKAHEPSMEEILASIRRIIADDDGPGGAAAADAATSPESAAAEDVLELTDPIAPTPPVPERADIEFRDADAPPSPPPPPSPPVPPRSAGPTPAEPVALRPPPRPAADRLLSPVADSAASSAFAALAHTVLAENSRTLEDLVHEMLRPMLKTWLDDNLPALVERLVRQEIERVSRGGRR
jgi:cell pole-organizing protein PopZ